MRTKITLTLNPEQAVVIMQLITWIGGREPRTTKGTILKDTIIEQVKNQLSDKEIELIEYNYKP